MRGIVTGERKPPRNGIAKITRDRPICLPVLLEDPRNWEFSSILFSIAFTFQLDGIFLTIFHRFDRLSRVCLVELAIDRDLKGSRYSLERFYKFWRLYRIKLGAEKTRVVWNCPIR